MSQEDVILDYEKIKAGEMYVLCYAQGTVENVQEAKNGDVVLACTSFNRDFDLPNGQKANGAVVLRTGYLLLGLLSAYSYVRYTPKGGVR